MSSGTDFKIVRRRYDPSRSKLAQTLLWIKFYTFWKLKHYCKVAATVVKMAIKREKRVYYTYFGREAVVITAFNYIQRVKTDGDDFAIIKFKTKTGFTYSKCERF